MRTFACPLIVRAAITLSALACAFTVPADAATTTGTLTVNATLLSSCNVSGSVLNFGSTIDPLSASVPVDASSTMSVQCTNTTPYAVSLNAGANAGGASAFSNRNMKHGTSNLLGYQLYLDSGRSTVWGDGTASSSTLAGTGTGSSQTLTIYGRLPSLTGAVPGGYTDTVTVTITY